MTAVDGSGFLRESSVNLNMESGLAVRVLEGVVVAPSTVSDDFNRADGAPGSGWYSSAIANWSIVSNQLRKAVSADSMMVWQTPNTNARQEASIKFTSNGNSSSFITMLVRISSASAQYGGGQTYYGAFFDMTGATCGFITETGQFGTPVLPTLVNGVTYTAALRVEGERISLYIDGLRCGTAEAIGGAVHVGNYVGISCAAVGSPILFDDFNSTTFAAQTATTDDFNRANTAPAANGGGLGDAWVTTGWQILGNAANSPGGNYAQHLTPVTNDHYVEADIIGWSSGYVFLTVRRPGNNVDTGYLAVIKSGGTDFEIAKLVNGSYTVLASGTAAVQGTATFRGRFEVQGNTLRFYRDGTLLITVTDSSLPTGRYTGMGSFVSGATIDNFACGPVTTTRIAYSHVWSDVGTDQNIPSSGPDTTAYSLGTIFTVSTNTVLYGARIWNPGQQTLTDPRRIRLYAGSTLQYTETVANVNKYKPGWNEVLFAVPQAVVTGTSYTICHDARGGTGGHGSEGSRDDDYGAKGGAMIAPPTTPPFSFSTDGGVFGGFGARPTSTFNSAWYGIDVLFNPQNITGREAQFVQPWKQASGLSGTTASITFNATPTAGNRIIVVAGAGTTMTTPAGYERAATALGNTEINVFTKISNGTETAISITLAVSASWIIQMAEVSGLLNATIATAVDKTNSSIVGSGTNQYSMAGATGTLAQADEFIVAAVSNLSSVTDTTGLASDNVYTINNNGFNGVSGRASNVANVLYIGVSTKSVHATTSVECWTVPIVNQVSGANQVIVAFKVEIPVVLNPTGFSDGKIPGFTKFGGGFDLGKSQADVPNRFIVYDTGYINFFFTKTIWQTPLSRAKHYISASLHGNAWLIYNASADGATYNAIEIAANGDVLNLVDGGGSTITNIGTPTNPYTLSIDATVAGNPVVKYNGVSVGAISLGGNVRSGSYVGIFLATLSDAGTIQIGL